MMFLFCVELLFLTSHKFLSENSSFLTYLRKRLENVTLLRFFFGGQFRQRFNCSFYTIIFMLFFGVWHIQITSGCKFYICALVELGVILLVKLKGSFYAKHCILGHLCITQEGLVINGYNVKELKLIRLILSLLCLTI